ncbi:EF-hand domain-containing protein [Candidatus Pelagibacter sp. HIMB1517]|uniref:EF-hand domain-containing protein n=1 Tax=Candidatus Pelagibacter sp. HIMB1517 TaxID=3413341 RepID=UPI003F87107A
MAKKKKTKKTKKSKKISKRKVSKRKVSKRSVTAKSSDNTNNIIYGAIAAAIVVLIIFAFPSGNQKSEVKETTPTQEVKDNKSQEVKENKVSDIKETKEVKPLNIPKKKKAIDQPSFNEKAVQIRFAEIDYNSNKKISLNEYLYYFENKDEGKKKFKRIDKNNNRSISYKEYLASKKR